ncbi:FAD-dependent oxidoreductase [Roseateles oligotrophus]|uniref:FAD-dependent oxidoreductase n=1 Tax=Roseateles oligotrophus TaxID=1769250 RepID=A0ABT2Y911_9BURK|nr:FAD-dependent oxidoreductase [Roseateles oligotrophus]MCV2366791.1 FAD-dependent oxidoreductase [Roseateles oligotrophus]
MRIAIIGAGIAGVTTAYECAADGHQVTVFERCGSVAAEGSFANAGITAPGLSLPWSPPQLPCLGGGAKLAWGWQRWRAGRDKTRNEQHERLLKLALFSHARLAELRRSLQMDYERADGVLVLLRSERELSTAQAGLALLGQQDISAQVLSAEQCLRIEPGLNPDTQLHGGVHLEQGEAGNCRQFTHLMRIAAQRLGVQFRFHTTVRQLTPGAPARLIHEYTPPPANLAERPRQTENGESNDSGDTRPAPMGCIEDSFDAVIICAGAGAASLLQTLKLKPALTTVHGYSITAPLRQLEAYPDLGPRAALFDQQQQVSISRIGQRIRLAGGIEPGAASERQKTSTHALLHRILNDWFPGSMLNSQIQQWQGSQALAADGLPLLGASGRDGIWLNLAQGSASVLGWPLACGAARALATQVAGRERGGEAPDITGLDICRFA